MEMMSYSVIGTSALPAYDHELTIYAKREMGGSPAVLGRHVANRRKRERGVLWSGMRRAGSWLSHGLSAISP